MPIRPRTAALGAGVCVALLAIVRLAAFHVGFFQHADQSIYVQFGDLHGHGRIEWVAQHMVSLINVDHYAIWVAALIVITLLRGRPRSAFAAGVIILGANASTELIKHAFAAPRAGWLIGPVSWPSGHSTAAMALALAAVLCAPARLRPAVAALGAAFAIGVGYSVVATGMHYPSDVLAGFLMAATWALGTVAALLRAERWRPSPVRQDGERVSVGTALGAPGAMLLAAVALGATALLTRPHQVASYVRLHEAFVVGALGIAALGFAVATGMLLSVVRR
jgi:membrane-associated phospholipid phosphatase